MAPNLRNKRSAARMVSPPFPTASSTMVFENAREARLSGDTVSSDGYSNLFTSGFMQQHIERHPSVSSFPSPPTVRGPFHPSPDKSEPRLSPPNLSPLKTPLRRRRSSIIHTTPMSSSPRVFKMGGSDGGVERALDNVMKTLKVMAMGTPLRSPRTPPSPPRETSRWSLSSEESANTEESGFWRPRKSGESTRSRVTIGTTKSGKSGRSLKSKKSRRSEDTDRMEVDEVVPPLPLPVPPVPVTPSRRKRMMEGLVKRLGLTPKKKDKQKEEGDMDVDTPVTPRLPRKSSLSTLRSAITKKTSTGTLRSVRSTKSSYPAMSHPFMGSGPTMDCEAFPLPPLPKWTDRDMENYNFEGCLPTTPRRRTTPKSKTSIGQPRLQPSTSPSLFLKELPRRAPGTPKDQDREEELPPMPSTDILDEYFAPSPARQVTVMPGTIVVPLEEKLRRAAEATREATPELSPSATSTGGSTFTPRTDSSPYLSTPISAHSTNNADRSIDTPGSFDTPPLTHRAAQDALKPKRLLNLLPKQSRVNLGIQTPPSTGLRQKTMTTTTTTTTKAATHRTPFGDKSNLPLHLQGPHTPDSISSVLSKAVDKRPGMSRFGTMASSPSINKPIQGGRRDPLGIIKRYESNPSPSHELPYQSGGDGWGTPALNNGVNCFDETFGRASGRLPVSAPNPDFTASPDISFNLVRDVSVRSRRSRRGSEASIESDLPTEEWELEAYLQELDRVDRERAARGQVGLGVGMGR